MRLLGSVGVVWRGRNVELRGSAAIALFALLVLRRGPRGREQLAASLWPDGGSSSAAWLRQALWQLRRAFGAGADTLVEADGETIGLRAGVEVDLDVAAFDAALRARPPSVERAIAMYRGRAGGGPQPGVPRAGA